MLIKYYLDACIWRDYYENRNDKFRPLGEWALMLINKIIKEENSFIVSDLIISELNIKYPLSLIEEIFQPIKKAGLLILINKTEFQVRDAWQFSKRRKIEFSDALHCILARDNDAILITRDKHFEKLSEIVVIKKPEDLI